MLMKHRHNLIRLNDIITPTDFNGGVPLISISRSGWLTGVKEGRFPQPIKLSPKVTVWRLSDIYELIESINSQHSN